MRKFKQLLLLVISITLVSCHTTGSIKQKAWKVQQGMTTEEIGQLSWKTRFPTFRWFFGTMGISERRNCNVLQISNYRISKRKGNKHGFLQ